MWSKEEIDLLMSNIDQYVKVLPVTARHQPAFGHAAPYWTNCLSVCVTVCVCVCRAEVSTTLLRSSLR